MDLRVFNYLGFLRQRGGFTYIYRDRPLHSIQAWGLVLALTFFAVLLNGVILLTYFTGHSSNIASEKNFTFDWSGQEPFDGKSALLASISEKNRRELNHQVRFVSKIISTHRRPANEIEELALSIVAESRKASYDPFFVAAVIRAESTFNRLAQSSVGAIGLMQLMPATARFVARREGLSLQTLHDPRENIRLGIAYLKQLEVQFGGNRRNMLIAYNWGPFKLEQSLKTKTRIPGSIMRYAQGIMATHRRWRSDFNLLLSHIDSGLLRS